MAATPRAIASLALLALALISAALAGASAKAKHPGPVILIHNVQELQNIQNNLSGNYRLANDIDASGFNFVPIGGDTPFTGTLDGNDFAIRNLTISQGVQCATRVLCDGLFGYASPSSVVRNVRLINVAIDVTCSDSDVCWIGGIAGLDQGTIVQTFVQGSVHVSARGSVGGLVGQGESVSFSRAEVDIAVAIGVCDSYIGGLAGMAQEISDSSASGDVSVTHAEDGCGLETFVGGLVGSAGYIARSYASGNVAAVLDANDFSIAGGLAGTADSISRSFAVGSVRSSHTAGGLAGVSYDIITDSFATGSAESTGIDRGYCCNAVGGLGGLSGSIARSFSIGKVRGNGVPAGGLTGHSGGGPLLNSYWNLNTSGIHDPSQGCGDVPNCPGVTGLKTRQMTNGKLKNFAGFDPNVWVAVRKKNKAFRYYPSLWAVPFPIPSFPIVGSTPYTFPISTVFDHSMQNARNSGQLTGLYACDEIVQAFDNQIGDRNYGYDRGGCSQPGYENSSHADFVLPGVNYTGAGCSGGSIYLNYDGHPGFDYCAPKSSKVYAAVSGVLYYPWKAVGMTKHSQYDAYCLFHTLGEVPDAGPSYRIYYLHLSTHWAVKGDVGPPDCSQYSGDTSGLTGQAFDHDPNCHYIDASGKEILDGDPRLTLPLPEGTHVQAGCQIALSGDAGVPGAPHLHFEIQQIVPAGALNDDGRLSRTYFQCFNENKKYNRNGMNVTSVCLPADPYGWTGPATQCTGDASSWTGDIWQCLTGIPSRRFWAQ